MRIWITDGSWPVFSDTIRLRAKHTALFGLRTRYEGIVDPEVSRGRATIHAERPDDALYLEAEWVVEFREGIERYLREPRLVNAATRITVQGMIEGKWVNRLLGTGEWRPASLGNNLVAAGPGLATSVGALDWGEGGAARIAYRTSSGAFRTQEAQLAGLRGHNTIGLLRDVLRVCADERIDGINLGAVGEHAAAVNERHRIKPAAHLSAHVAKERLVRGILADDFPLPPGGTASLVVTDPAGTMVGEGELTLAAR